MAASASSTSWHLVEMQIRKWEEKRTDIMRSCTLLEEKLEELWGSRLPGVIITRVQILPRGVGWELGRPGQREDWWLTLRSSVTSLPALIKVCS